MPNTAHRFRIALEGIDPPVWRRIRTQQLLDVPPRGRGFEILGEWPGLKPLAS